MTAPPPSLPSSLAAPSTLQMVRVARTALRASLRASPPCAALCTRALACALPRLLGHAAAGDSRAVLVSTTARPEALSYDHKVRTAECPHAVRVCNSACATVGARSRLFSLASLIRAPACSPTARTRRSAFVPQAASSTSTACGALLAYLPCPGSFRLQSLHVHTACVRRAHTACGCARRISSRSLARSCVRARAPHDDAGPLATAS